MGSRAIYHDGWMACAFGPRTPWVPGLPPGIREWTPDKDVWELYNLEEDWTQANDLAAKMPEKLAQMKEIFLIEATKNKGLPIGGGLWVVRLHPEMRISAAVYGVDVHRRHHRMPEFTAPALGNKPNVVTIDAEIPANANGVLYKLGANRGGLTCSLRTGYSATNTTCSSFSAPRSARQRNFPPARRRSRWRPYMSMPRPARSAQSHPQGQRQGRRHGSGARQRRVAVHRQRLPRHRHRPRFAGVARLLRKGPLQVQRNDREGVRELHMIRRVLSTTSKSGARRTQPLSRRHW